MIYSIATPSIPRPCTNSHRLRLRWNHIRPRSQRQTLYRHSIVPEPASLEQSRDGRELFFRTSTSPTTARRRALPCTGTFFSCPSTASTTAHRAKFPRDRPAQHTMVRKLRHANHAAFAAIRRCTPLFLLLGRAQGCWGQAGASEAVEFALP